MSQQKDDPNYPKSAPPAQKPIYLGKDGQVFGPFTEEDIESLQLSGRLYEYAYRWDASSGAWNPVPPPMPPQGGKVIHANPPAWSRKTSPEPAPEKTLPVMEWKETAVPLLAICRDALSTLSGEVSQIGPEGCKVVSAGGHSGSPLFGPDSKVWLNLLDERAGKAMNLPTRISSITRQGGHWVYCLEWIAPPQSLSAGAR